MLFWLIDIKLASKLYPQLWDLYALLPLENLPDQTGFYFFHAQAYLHTQKTPTVHDI